MEYLGVKPPSAELPPTTEKAERRKARSRATTKTTRKRKAT
jgi:hypothetical protein